MWIFSVAALWQVWQFGEGVQYSKGQGSTLSYTVLCNFTNKKCKNPSSFVLTMLLRLYLFFSVGVVQFHRKQAVWCSVRGRGTKQVRSVRNTASHHVSGFLMMAVCWWCSVLGVNIHMYMYLYNLCIAGQYQSWNWKIKDLAEKTTTSDIS